MPRRRPKDDDPAFEFPQCEGSPPTDFRISVMEDGALHVDVGGEYGGFMDAEAAARMASAILKRTGD